MRKRFNDYLKRWAWFIGIYLASLAVFAGSVYVLRWLIK
jgi:hypothetical protein